MTKMYLLAAGALILFTACANQEADVTIHTGNPFFEPYDTAYDVHPFDRILPEHFEPAFTEAMTRPEGRASGDHRRPHADFENTSRPRPIGRATGRGLSCSSA